MSCGKSCRWIYLEFQSQLLSQPPAQPPAPQYHLLYFNFHRPYNDCLHLARFRACILDCQKQTNKTLNITTGDFTDPLTSSYCFQQPHQINKIVIESIAAEILPSERIKQSPPERKK